MYLFKLQTFTCIAYTNTMKRGAEKQLTQDDPEAEGDDINNVGLSFIVTIIP